MPKREPSESVAVRLMSDPSLRDFEAFLLHRAYNPPPGEAAESYATAWAHMRDFIVSGAGQRAASQASAGGLWDAKSRADVLAAHRQCLAHFGTLSGLVAAADADPASVADAFEQLAALAEFGATAAAWCEQVEP